MGSGVGFAQSLSSGGSGGSGDLTPTSITYADLLSAVTTGDATAGFYLITDATQSTGTMGDLADCGVVVEVVIGTQGIPYVSLEAIGIFMNPDFQEIGFYDWTPSVSKPAYVATVGMWFSGLTPTAGDVAFYDGYHYVSKTGMTGTAPSGDSTNWTLLPKTEFGGPTTAYGYAVEADSILYDFATDTIVNRRDKRRNDINTPIYFQWGNNTCNSNNQKQQAFFSNINTVVGFNNNTCFGSEILYVDNEYLGAVTESVFTLYGNLTLDSNSGAITKCVMTITPTTNLYNGTNYLNQLLENGYSDFQESFSLTGLTTFNFTSNLNYIGIANCDSGNATESINLFSNFPIGWPVKIYPEVGLQLTFVHNTGANQPRCEGGVNAVLNGSNGDWIEFTKLADGFIYQTNIGTY